MDLKERLTSLDLNKGKLSQALGVAKQTVSAWNKDGLPKYADAYLKLLEKHNDYKGFYDTWMPYIMKKHHENIMGSMTELGFKTK